MPREYILLVVEDDDGNYELLKRSLTRYGILCPILRFTEANSLFDYLLTARLLDYVSHRDYIVLLDLNLPGMHGIEILDRIKREPSLKKTAVVAVTSSSDSQTIQRCEQAGCDGFFIKPLDPGALVEHLEAQGIELPVAQTTNS